jgi:hypothetical protein
MIRCLEAVNAVTTPPPAFLNFAPNRFAFSVKVTTTLESIMPNSRTLLVDFTRQSEQSDSAGHLCANRYFAEQCWLTFDWGHCSSCRTGRSFTNSCGGQEKKFMLGGRSTGQLFAPAPFYLELGARVHLASGNEKSHPSAIAALRVCYVALGMNANVSVIRSIMFWFTMLSPVIVWGSGLLASLFFS